MEGVLTNGKSSDRWLFLSWVDSEVGSDGGCQQVIFNHNPINNTLNVYFKAYRYFTTQGVRCREQERDNIIAYLVLVGHQRARDIALEEFRRKAANENNNNS